MSTYTPTHVRSDVSNPTDTVVPTDRDVRLADTGSGLLVFASVEDGVSEELIAFADVSDWSAIRAALQARGLGVGAIGHLPEVNRTGFSIGR